MVDAGAGADDDGDDLTFQNAASQHMFRLLFVSSPLDEKTYSENRRFPLVKRHVQPLHENDIKSEGKTMTCRTPRHTSTHLRGTKNSTLLVLLFAPTVSLRTWVSIRAIAKNCRLWADPRS